MSENRLIIYPREYKPRKADIPSQEQVQTTIHDLILRIDTLRDEVLPNLHAALLDPTIHDEERHRRERTIQEIIVRIERADHLVAEMEQYIHKEHASLARLIEDNRFKHLQHLVAIIERAVSEEALPGVLHEAGEHMENSQESPLLPPDSFHPEWYSEADIEQANHLLAVDLEELIGPDIELKDHLDTVVRFLFDPMVIVELKKRMRDKSSLQPASLLFIKEKDPNVWQSLITLLHSSKGKEVLLHILGKPIGPTPTAGEMEEYTARMYAKLPNIFIISLSYSVDDLEDEAENIREAETGALTEFYGTLPGELCYYRDSLLYEIVLEELLEHVKDINVKTTIRGLVKLKPKQLIDSIEDIILAINALQKMQFTIETKIDRTTLIEIVVKKISELFKYADNISLELNHRTRSPVSDSRLDTLSTTVLRFFGKWENIAKRERRNSKKIELLQNEIKKILFAIQSLCKKISEILLSLPDSQKKKIAFSVAKCCVDYIKYVEKSNMIIKDHLDENKKLYSAEDMYLADQDFQSIDMSKWNFTNANLDRIILKENIVRFGVPDGQVWKLAPGLSPWIEAGSYESVIYDITKLLKRIAVGFSQLQGANLSGQEIPSLAACNLTAANLTNTLIGSLKGATLCGANIRGLSMIPSNTETTNHLQDTDFTDCDLRSVFFGKHSFKYTKLDRAIVGDSSSIPTENKKTVKQGTDENGIFRNSLLVSKINQGIVHHISGLHLCIRELPHKVFREVTFTSCDLSYSEFENSTLENFVFENCRLHHCDFSFTTFRNVRFKYCDLDGAKFRGTKNIPPTIKRRLDKNGVYRKQQ